MKKFILLIFLVVLSSCSILRHPNHTYRIRYSGTLCKEMVVMPCGGYLYDCDNGKEYYCMRDISDTTEK